MKHYLDYGIQYSVFQTPPVITVIRELEKKNLPVYTIEDAIRNPNVSLEDIYKSKLGKESFYFNTRPLNPAQNSFYCLYFKDELPGSP